MDGITVRARDILRETAVVTGIDGVAQKAANGYDQKEFHSNTARTG